MKIRNKILSTLAASVLCLGLFSCEGGGEVINEIADVTATCKLSRSFESKTFEGDGIEEATITSYVDGDTTNVTTVNSKKSYKIRYLSIDTPESTVGYDKWGKAASVYNKQVLSTATSIVIESEGSTAEKDSSGSRYLAYVWYKTADSDTYRNFNLELVENGYTRNNCTTDGKYYTYFEKAEKKASKLGLHLWGNEDDIYYSEVVNPVTLKELKDHAGEFYDKDTQIPVCVSFDAYVVSMDDASARTVTVEQFDATDKKYHQYKVFVGYSGTRVHTLSIVGNYLHYVGWPTGEGSIHGCVALAGKKDGLYSYRIGQNYVKTLTSAKITEATLADGVATFKVRADNKVYTLTYTDSEVTEATIKAYVSSASRTIKCFIPNNNADDEATDGYINLLTDID